MNDVWNSMNSESQFAISTLALKVELKHGNRYRPNKNERDLVQLLREASQSKEKEVFDAWCEVNEHLSQEQARFFRKKGVVIPDSAAAEKPKKSQGFNSNATAATGSEAKSSRGGKRKIVYRGQVKWVDE